MHKNEHSHVPGAYIRSLVKQLTSPKTQDTMNLKDVDCPNSAEPQQPLKHKKQVRRRLHTSRPYQERLLNMAEARKEIVTALKYHRAAMKQQQPQQQQKIQIYPSNFTPNNSFPWSTSPQIAPEAEKHNLALPSQPLGLNLNLNDITSPSSVYSSSSSYSPTLSVVTEEDQNQHPGAADLTESRSSGGLHQAMGDEEMEEMRSMGEQHEMEWNDTMNLMTSAWWFRFFKEEEEEEECRYNNPFDELIQRQFTSWFNPNELQQQQQQQHQYCYCYQDYYSLLPW